MSKYIYTLKLSNLPSASVVWQNLYPLLCQNLKMNSFYHTRYYGSITKKSVSDINKYISEEASDTFFSLSDKDSGNNQKIVFFESHNTISISCEERCLNIPYLALMQRLLENFDISNAYLRVKNCDTYINTAISSKWFSPPNSNLYMMPALTNQREYYIERLDAEMWFGESFWQYAACSRAEVKACHWLQTEEWENNVLYVKAYHKEFDEAEGEQLEIQRKLLKLLFNIDENRPHGMADHPMEKTKVFSQSVLVDGDQVEKLGDLTEEN